MIRTALLASVAVVGLTTALFGADFSCKPYEKFNKKSHIDQALLLEGSIESAKSDWTVGQRSDLKRKLIQCAKKRKAKIKKKKTFGSLLGAVGGAIVAEKGHKGEGAIGGVATSAALFDGIKDKKLLSLQSALQQVEKSSPDMPEKGASAPMVPQSAHIGPVPPQLPDTKAVYFNRSESSAFCMPGNKNPKFGGRGSSQLYEQEFACMPSRQVAATNHFDVKGLSLPINIDQLKQCSLWSDVLQVTAAGQNISIQFTAICWANNHPTKISVEVTEKAFWVERISIPVCGPNFNFPDSNWDKRVRTKYAVDSDNIFSNSEAGVIHYSADFKTKMQHSENIIIGIAGTRSDFQQYLKCEAQQGSTVWEFTIKNTTEGLWHDHIADLLASTQKGDSF